MKRFTQCTILAIATSLLAGCGLSVFMYNMFPPEIPPEYILIDQSTLVLVDDPDGELGDPSLPNAMAARIAADLKNAELFETSELVGLEKINMVMRKHGEDYYKMPIDQIGRETGAKQVVHVHIDSASWVPTAGLWRPTGRARVKVIDSATGKRLFPRQSIDDGASNPTTRRRGIVVTELQPRASASVEPDDVPQLRHLLADRLGRDVARVFHAYTIDRDPGAKFRD